MLTELETLISRQRDITRTLRSMLQSDDSDSSDIKTLADELSANDDRINSILEERD